MRSKNFGSRTAEDDLEEDDLDVELDDLELDDF